MKRINVLIVATAAFLSGLLVAYLSHGRANSSRMDLYVGAFEIRCAKTDELIKAGMSVSETDDSGISSSVSPILYEMPVGGPYRVACMGVGPLRVNIECDGYKSQLVDLEKITGTTAIGGNMEATVIRLNRVEAEQDTSAPDGTD